MDQREIDEMKQKIAKNLDSEKIKEDLNNLNKSDMKWGVGSILLIVFCMLFSGPVVGLIVSFGILILFVIVIGFIVGLFTK